MSDKGTVTYERGTYYYRASQLGNCARALTAARLGLPPRPPSDRSEYYFAEGHLYEEAAKERLREGGWETWGDQTEVILPIINKVAVRGHTDGFARKQEREFVLEVKSAGGNVFNKLLNTGFRNWLWSKPSYLWQISVYMHATGKPALYVVMEREDVEKEDRGEVINWAKATDSTQFDDLAGGRVDRRVKIATLTEPPISRQDIRRKVLEIEVAAREEAYPSCPPLRQLLLLRLPRPLSARPILLTLTHHRPIHRPPRHGGELRPEEGSTGHALRRIEGDKGNHRRGGRGGDHRRWPLLRHPV